jgi:hypothetical protein
MHIQAKGTITIRFDEIIDMDDNGVFDEHGVLLATPAVIKLAVCAHVQKHIGELEMNVDKLKVAPVPE